MKNRTEYILISLLWLLVVTLGASFWFGTRYGFNLFSGAHWQYLARLQASNTPVAASFYISLVVAAFVMFSGLYLLTRIPGRNVIGRRDDTSVPAAPTPARTIPEPAQAPAPDAPAAGTTVTPAANAERPAEPTPAPAMTRPPRLNIPVAPRTMNTAPAPTPSATVTTTAAPAQTDRDIRDLNDIFTAAGYTVKPNPKIGDVTPALFAIGTNEVLWIGAVGIETTRMRRAIDRLAQVFSDTLDDIYISINGFVIGAPDAGVSEFQDILMFDSVAAVRDYMATHPNPPLPPDEAGNFDAYSAYIGTVIDYIGKI